MKEIRHQPEISVGRANMKNNTGISGALFENTDPVNGRSEEGGCTAVGTREGGYEDVDLVDQADTVRGDTYDAITHDSDVQTIHFPDSDDDGGQYSHLNEKERKKNPKEPTSREDRGEIEQHAYSKLRHSKRKSSSKTASESKAPGPPPSTSPQVYAMVNKPKRPKPPPSQQPVVEYATINKAPRVPAKSQDLLKGLAAGEGVDKH